MQNEGFPDLLTLDLKRNLISTIEVGAFNCSNKLTTLDLSGNILAEISPEMFTGLRFLEILNLVSVVCVCVCVYVVCAFRDML